MSCGNTTAGRHVCIIHECTSMCCNGSPLRPSLTHLDGTAVAPRLHRRPWSSCDRAGERKVDVLDSQRNSGTFTVVSSQFSG